MAAKKKAKAEKATEQVLDGTPAPAPEVSKFQRFRMARLHRSAVTNCPYNPRKTNARQRRLLQDFVKGLGLLEPLVVNTAYMLVGGHQRLAALDRLEKSGDYWLDFAVNELSPKQEREAVVGLNSPNLQGEWDLPLLASIIGDKAIGFDWERVGFEAVGLESIYDGSGIVLDMFDTKSAPAAVQHATSELLDASGRGPQPSDEATPFDGDDPDAADAGEGAGASDYDARKARIIDEKAKLAAAEAGPQNDTDYLISIVCKGVEDRVRLARALGLDDPEGTRYVDARLVWELLERARGR